MESETETTKDLLTELFNASAELRFAVVAKTRSLETNPSWFRHTQVMIKVEEALKRDKKICPAPKKPQQRSTTTFLSSSVILSV